MIFQEKIKIALENINPEQFYFKDCKIGNDDCLLVFPKGMENKWTQNNKYLRSCIFRKSDFYPISLGMFKFTNLGENPENFPPPKKLDNCSIPLKIDGSCLIVSKYKSEYIFRTRGTYCLDSMANKDEIEIFKQKFLKDLDIRMESLETWPYTFVWEWVTPSNAIVKKYEEIDFYLLNVIDHRDYSYWTQSSVSNLADLINAKRPKSFSFKELDLLVKEITDWESEEGVVIYSPFCNIPDQSLFKIKSNWYLNLHRIKSELKNEDNLIDLFLNLNCPDYKTLENYITSTFDYEIFKVVRPSVSRIIDAYKEVLKIEKGFKDFVEKLKLLPNRKMQAEAVFSSYGKETNRSNFLFQILDGKPLTNENYKKLIWQVLKKD